MLHMLVYLDFQDAAGAFITGEETMITVLPGQTTAMAGQSFSAGAAAELIVRLPEDTTAYLPFDRASGTVEFEGIQSAEVAGVRNTSGTLVSSLPVDQGYLQLYVVYLDAAGTVIGGASGAVESVPAGVSLPFEIADTAPPAGVATTNVYWQLGGQLW